MHYLARMVIECAPPIVDGIVTGHFRCTGQYSCWRSLGLKEWSIIYTSSGRGRFASEQGILYVNPGEAVLIPPGVRHDYGTLPGERWDLVWAVFDPPQQWDELLAWPAWGDSLFWLKLELPLRHTVVERLLAMHRLAMLPTPRATQLALNALEAALLLADSANPLSHRTAPTDPAIAKVLDHIADHLDRPLPLMELAGISGQSMSRLCHVFTRTVGVSPQTYVEKQRLKRACQLLHRTQLSIKEVSEQLGFSSPFYFARRFKRVIGMTPSAYRHGV